MHRKRNIEGEREKGKKGKREKGKREKRKKGRREEGRKGKREGGEKGKRKALCGRWVQSCGQLLDPSVSPSPHDARQCFTPLGPPFLSCQVSLYKSGLRGLFYFLLVIYAFMQID